MVQIDFDANSEDPYVPSDRDFVPAGWYKVVITDTEELPTKSKTGAYIRLDLTVVDGEYKGAKLVDRLNYRNPNETAVQIAKRQLSAICHAVGVLQPKDTSQLHMKPLECKVAVKDDATYGPQSEVKGYRGTQSAPANEPATNNNDTPAWRKAPTKIEDDIPF